MHFGHVEIFVSDLAAARAFYTEALGFVVTVDQGDGMLWLQKGELEILLRPGKPPASPVCYEAAPLGLVLYTDNLEQTAAEMRRRGVAFRGTVDSEKCLTFTDPDGNWFQLVDPADH